MNEKNIISLPIRHISEWELAQKIYPPIEALKQLAYSRGNQDLVDKINSFFISIDEIEKDSDKYFA